MMESPQFLRISDSPFEMRMKSNCDVDFAEITKDIVDLDSDLAARDFFVQLQMLREKNLKQYGGEDNQGRMSKVLTVQLAEEETPQAPHCVQESPAEKAPEEFSEARTVSTESSCSNSTFMSVEDSNFDESEGSISIEVSASEIISSCDNQLPPNVDSPTVENCSVSHLGIERPNYADNSEGSSDHRYFYTSFNIPPPLYGNGWGDEPDMSDYFYPEILSVIEEVDFEDDDYSIAEGNNLGENIMERGGTESSLCNCDLYISEGGIRIVKSSSISSDEERNISTDHNVFRSPCDDSEKVLKHMSQASTTEETESSEEAGGKNADEDYDEFYKEENCLFFLDGCVSLFSRFFLTEKQSCLISPSYA
mmetsp:Transcript_14402/g.29053  ORF Transcript_14402/g.29053 Transcript_14402/m.29053 type:complete len:365 (+) Transcript_14402:147-1241(+)